MAIWAKLYKQPLSILNMDESGKILNQMTFYAFYIVENTPLEKRNKGYDENQEVQ